MRVNKKNKKKIIIAVALGGIATFFIFGSMNSKNAAMEEMNRMLAEQKAAMEELQKNPFEEEEKNSKIHAVIAAGDLNVGDVFTAELLEVKEYDEDALPEGYFKTVAMVVGKKAGKNLVKGQFITTAEIQSEDISSIEIPNDMRAISIPTERFKGLASHIRVGSRVDLLKASGTPEFIAQNIRIVAFEAGTTADSGGSRYNANAGNRVSTRYLSANRASAITFLIPVDLVSGIMDSISGGQLQIITRNNNDDKVVITEKELPPPPSENLEVVNIKIPDEPLKGKNLEPPSMPAPEPRKVEIIKATAVSTIDFETEGLKSLENEKKDSTDSSTDLSKLKELLDMVQ